MAVGVVQLQAEYEALEDAVVREKWALADWLAANVPSPGVGKSRSTAISLDDVAEWRGRSVRWLSEQRQMAQTFSPDRRNPKYSVTAHSEAWKQTQNVAVALALLDEKGGSTRALRGNKGDGIESISKRPVEQRQHIAAELLKDPEVRSGIEHEIHTAARTNDKEGDVRAGRARNREWGQNTTEFERFSEALRDGLRQLHRAAELAENVDFDAEDAFGTDRREWLGLRVAEIREAADDLDAIREAKTMSDDEIRKGVGL